MPLPYGAMASRLSLSAALRRLFASFSAILLATAVAASPFRLSTGKTLPSLSYAAASPAWSAAVGGVLSQYGAQDLASLAPSLKTTLPALGDMNFASPAAQKSLAPVIYNIEQSLSIPADEFAALPPSARKEIVAMAVEESMQAAAVAAYDLVNEAHHALYVAPGGTPSQEMLLRMERLQRDFGGFLEEQTGEKLKTAYRAARRRAKELERARVGELFNETASALKRDVDPEILFTPQFRGDAKNFREGDWERLGREFSKLREILRADTPRKGEIGNVKFLGGPLAGVGEFKFGAGRTHRIYFRYRPEDDAVALLHYAPREHANNPARVYEKVQRMIETGSDADAVPPDAQILNLMASVEERDLGALAKDIWDIPAEELPVKTAAKTPEERAPPPSPLQRR